MPTSLAPVVPPVDPWPLRTEQLDFEPPRFDPLELDPLEFDSLDIDPFGSDPDLPDNAPVTAPIGFPGEPLDDEPDGPPVLPADEPTPALPAEEPTPALPADEPRSVAPAAVPVWPGLSPSGGRRRRSAVVVAIVAVTVTAVALLAAAAVNVVRSQPNSVGVSDQRDGSLGLAPRGRAPGGGAGGADNGRPAVGAPGVGSGSSGVAVPDGSGVGPAPAPAGPPPPVHAVSAPLGGLTQGEFDVVAGVTTVTVRTGASDNVLYRAATLESAGYVPRVVQNGGRVQLDLDNINEADHAPAVEVLLNPRVRWRIRMVGGAASSILDLRRATLSGLEIVGGAKQVELSLPRPTGNAVTRISGGAADVTVHLPQGLPVRVRIGRGASSATIDGIVHAGIAPGTVFTPRGFDRSRDQQDVDVAAGVSSITVDRY